MAQYEAAIDLADIGGKTGFRIDGDAGSGLGLRVATVGDLNGDGFDDIMVGARMAGPHQEGRDYVIYGAAGGFGSVLSVSDLDGSNGFYLQGAEMSENVGVVGPAGDVNGDGYRDLVVGSTASSSAHGSIGGAAYVVFGSAAGFAASFDLGDLDGSNGFRVTGVPQPEGEGVGSSVTAAGDINGDGYDDVVIGADANKAGGALAGRIYVVYGKASGFSASFDGQTMSAADGFHIDGAAGDQLGNPSGVGDINGDGYDDMVIAAPGRNGFSGAAYVVFGKAGGFGTSVDLSSLDGSDGFRMDGLGAGDETGVQTATADINGDGFADMILASPMADANGANSGATYVIFGKASGFAPTQDLSALDGSNGFLITGGAAHSYAGLQVASAGDVNGDGFEDIILSPYNGGGGDRCAVLFGHAGGFDASISLASLDGTNGFSIDPVANYGNVAVSSAGDMNGDGLDDLLVGYFLADSGGTDSGDSYVIFGQQARTALHLSGTEIGQHLVGGTKADVLKARGGDDKLWGHNGDDTMAGGLGNDTLIGGQGKDVLNGRAGKDIFVFTATSESPDRAGADTILDLQNTDRIDLSAIDADTTTKGNQAFHLVSAFTHHAGELRLLGADGGGPHTFLEGDVDGDGHADFVVKLRGDHTDFTHFVL